MSGLTAMAALGAALLLGMVWGVGLENSAWKRATSKRRKAISADEGASTTSGEAPRKKPLTASKLIAFWMLGLTTVVSAATLYLMRLCVLLSFTGALYPLSALITLCQAGNAVVLAAYFSKSKAENTAGGITYDAALGKSTFDTV